MYLVNIHQLMKSIIIALFILHDTSCLRMTVTVIYETEKKKGCRFKASFMRYEVSAISFQPSAVS